MAFAVVKGFAWTIVDVALAVNANLSTLTVVDDFAHAIIVIALALARTIARG